MARAARIKHLLALSLVGMTPLAPHGETARAETGSVVTKADFSAVKSVASAYRLEKAGGLVRVLAFPSELGGHDVPENVFYVTPEAAGARNLIIGTLTRLVQEGTIDKMTVNPEFRGDSIVPTRIVFRTSHGKTSGTFQAVIEVW